MFSLQFQKLNLISSLQLYSMTSLFKSREVPDSCNSTTARLLRVVDILREEGGGGFGMSGAGETEEDSVTVRCLSPRRIVARWLRRKRRAAADGGDSDDRLVCGRCLRSGVDGGASSSSPTEIGGSGLVKKEDSSFNLGVGSSLLYLVLASKNELSKMVDLRLQMEHFLQNIKEDLGRKNNPFEPFHMNTDVACSSTDCQDGPCSTSQFSYQQDSSSQVLSDAQSTVPNHPRKSCLHERGECREPIDELESEFEAELERLQLHFEDESSSGRIDRLRIETAKNTDSTRSCMSSGEAIDILEDGTERQRGFSPIELERKLHELLEARQEERIKELECALECAKQEVMEKESEVSWWKETAKVISKHIPAHSRLSLASQHDQLQLQLHQDGRFQS